MDAFHRRYGTNAGRIQPTNATPVDGDWVYVLGSDETGSIWTLNHNDRVSIEQSIDVTGVKFIRVRAHLRGVTLPADTWWVFKGDNSAGGNQPYRLLHEDDDLDILDYAIDVSQLAGAQTITFELELVAPLATSAIEVELPGVYLDLVTEDTPASRLQLFTRMPEPNETGVPVEGYIVIHLTDTNAAGSVSLANTDIYVDGVLAVSGGVIQAAFAGTYSGVASLANGHQFTLVPITPFTSLATIPVRVVSQTTDTLESMDTTYSFTVEDKTAPLIAAVQATALEKVRVTYNEAMTMSDATATGDALNPANYSIIPLEVPAITPTIESVTAISSTVVELTLGAPLSFGKSHQITIVNVTDLNGNAIAAGSNTATFTSVTPASPQGRDFRLWYMLPRKNRVEDETGDLSKFVACLQDVADLLLYELDRYPEILDPDFAEEQYLDAMLADLGNPFNFELTENDKRRLLRVLWQMYKQRGTDRGIINVVRFFVGVEVTVEPWLDSGTWTIGIHQLGSTTVLGPSGSWAAYAFNIETAAILTDEQRTRITELVTYMKPDHTHLVYIIDGTGTATINHLLLGWSKLGVNWKLH